MLWTLSGDLPVHLFGTEFNMPGYMVWCAVAYALIGSLLTYALGRGLIDAGNVRQGREADFRSVLTRAREHAEGIALMRGEDDERERLRGSLFDLRSAWHRQTRGQGNLSLLTSSLAYLAPIVPLIVALPRYLSGQIQLGGLMQTAQAFSSVQWALSLADRQLPQVRRMARLDQPRRAPACRAHESRGQCRGGRGRAHHGASGDRATIG